MSDDPTQRKMKLIKYSGTGLMLIASLFYIFGSIWYFEPTFNARGWWLPLFDGSLFGIPALSGTALAWWKPKVGAPVSIALFLFVAQISLIDTFWGDSGLRAPGSLLVTTVIYMSGALIVFLSSFKRR
jgi:hypothetical protein